MPRPESALIFHRGFIGSAGLWSMRPAALCAVILLAACSPDPADILMPAGDIKPPSVIEAGQRGPGEFRILFDEDVQPVEGCFSFEPEDILALPSSDGGLLTIALEPAAGAGEACSLLGEARDASGNTTRFLFSFVAYNENPAILRLNEVQTGKNSSASNSHRDYMEFTVEEGGNLGGIQVQWASSVKVMSYSFPPCEAASGSVIVLHCAPEGIASEKDETGSDLSASGGIDSSASGRDFWTGAGGIPDETGLALVRLREGEAPMDALLFASSGKSGAIDSPKLIGLLGEMTEEGLWPLSEPPLWEEGFRWKASASKPLHRKREGGCGPDQWEVGESGSQSPGRAAAGLAGGAAKRRK